ncbi:MAG: YihY/virulence factor BrkB family protein [Rhodobiaceae bacterium]|nr:YihY/virulence factor BrkB family protein [Rhodobiaceae bacterium]MCC0056410.1 YihY/virulence factor BrkB family protein [Rhodobiaceae bacterium]
MAIEETAADAGFLQRGWQRLNRATAGMAGDVVASIANPDSGRAAAGVTFYIVLAIFPALAVFVSVYGLVADPTRIRDHVDLLQGFVPPSALDLITGELQRINATQRETLSLSLVGSALFSLWSANNGMRALFSAINDVYGDIEARSFLRLLGVSLFFTICAVLFGSLIVNILVAVPIVLSVFGLESVPGYIGAIGSPLLLFIVVNIAITVLYRWGPNRSRRTLRWLSPGSAIATLAWMTASAAFAFYLANFANYGAAYGSLGTVIGVMMWFYVSTYVIIIGAELNARLERRFAFDHARRRETAP